MATITVYRGITYSDSLTCTVASGETQAQIVWTWRLGSNVSDWKISKTVSISNNSFTAELSSSETCGLPFKAGYMQWYYIHGTTGVKRFGGGYDVSVSDIAASLDNNATTPTGHYTFSNFTTLVKDTPLSGSYTLTGSERFCRIACDVHDVPEGSGITFTVYLDGVATSTTIAIAAGGDSNSATISPSVVGTAAQVMTIVPTSVGSTFAGGSASVTIYWYD